MGIREYIESAQPVNILAGQLVCDIDEAAGYYGSVSPNGTWCIKKLTSTTLLYAFGVGDYQANWTNRASLTYSQPVIST